MSYTEIMRMYITSLHGLRLSDRDFARVSAFVIFACLAIVGCSEGVDSSTRCASCDIDVVKSELYSLNTDLEILRAVREQGMKGTDLEELVVTAVLRHIIMIRAANFDVEDLPGVPIEMLCRLSTDEVRSIVDDFPDQAIKDMAKAYIDEISPAVLEHVRNVQGNLLGSGCSLSPR